jgi:aminoglycoside phosphotransferase (APT) family kinase protein
VPPPVGGPVEGIDVERVTRWFSRAVPGAQAPLRFSLIAGGRSNLTYEVLDAAGRRYALRRPPLSHVLPTAHDMAREHRVISALVPTDVPVPRTLALCLDPEVNGAPFYVMEFVEGHILRDASAAAALDEPARRRAGHCLAETLAALHAVDVDAVGLGDFAKREGYVERQLRRWHEQFRASVVDDGIDTASVVDDVHRRLAADIPPQRASTIVHGDFRLDNTVLGDDGTVRAVLDWEICTLGDPLADVGLLMVYWTEPGDTAALVGVTPTTAPGFPSRAEMRRVYAERSGRDLSDLDYYVAFGYWKLACILQGVYARYVGGAAAGDRSSVEGFRRSVVSLAETARSTLEAR